MRRKVAGPQLRTAGLRSSCLVNLGAAEGRLSPPEQEARLKIDVLLELAGWLTQDAKAAHIHAARGVAIREFPLPGYGFADYLLYVAGKAVGVTEAKKVGSTLTGVKVQSTKYHQGLPVGCRAGATHSRFPMNRPASRPASLMARSRTALGQRFRLPPPRIPLFWALQFLLPAVCCKWQILLGSLRIRKKRAT